MTLSKEADAARRKRSYVRRVIAHQRRLAILADLEAGLRVSAVAARYGVTATYVRNVREAAERRIQWGLKPVPTFCVAIPAPDHGRVLGFAGDAYGRKQVWTPEQQAAEFHWPNRSRP